MAAKRVTKRMVFLNSRHGWELRQLARCHRVTRTTNKYCALCYSNLRPNILRVKTPSACNKCHVNLWTIPRQGETGLSCFEQRRNQNVLKERIYKFTTSQQQSTDSHAYTPPAPTQPETFETESPPPTRKSHNEPKSKRSQSTQSTRPPEIRRKRHKRAGSPGMRQFRDQRSAEDKEQKDREIAETETQQLINNWKASGRSLKNLLKNVRHVAPPLVWWCKRLTSTDFL